MQKKTREVKEKDIETSIIEYLRVKGVWVEGLQSGSVIIRKGPYVHRMTLCTEGTPDIICCYKGNFIAIEVKKNQEEYDAWLKIEQRYLASSGILPKSYDRESNQIKHKYNILKNGGIHLLTWQLKEVIDLFDNLGEK